jgi:hypothetical protein
LVLFSCISLDAATVSVSVSPGGQTVKVKPANVAEEIGINTAEYNVSGTFAPSSLETNEVKPVDPVWNCTCSNVTFVPPVGVQPVPQNPGNPSVSISGTKPWVAKVSSPNAGQWKLQFKITVTYDVLDKKTGSKKPNEKFGPYESTGECTFIATSKPWKVTITSEKSVVCRKATALTQKIVPYRKVTAKLIDADSAKTVVVSSSGGGVLRFGLSANAENVTNTTLASLSLTIPKDGSKDFYVSGETESLKTGDVLITTTSTDAVPEIVGSTNMTVLWVNISLKDKGTVSTNNPCKGNVINLGSGNDSLGGMSYTFTRDDGKKYVVKGYAYEVRGDVLPSDFTENVVLCRDAHVVFIDLVGGKYTVISKYASDYAGEKPVSDMSHPQFRHDVPTPIFDYDVPGLSYTIAELSDPKYDEEFRANFREFAAYDDIRCSDVLEFTIVVQTVILHKPGRGYEVKEFAAKLEMGKYDLSRFP